MREERKKPTEKTSDDSRFFFGKEPVESIDVLEYRFIPRRHKNSKEKDVILDRLKNLFQN